MSAQVGGPTPTPTPPPVWTNGVPWANCCPAVPSLLLWFRPRTLALPLLSLNSHIPPKPAKPQGCRPNSQPLTLIPGSNSHGELLACVLRLPQAVKGADSLKEFLICRLSGDTLKSSAGGLVTEWKLLEGTTVPAEGSVLTVHQDNIPAPRPFTLRQVSALLTLSH